MPFLATLRRSFTTAAKTTTTTTAATTKTATTQTPPAATIPNLVTLYINDVQIQVPTNTPIITAAQQAGVHIPRFCYHDRLAVAGNCRMCLVEVERMPKPVASCSVPVQNGMKVKTDTPIVNKAREGVMEFILANHPLDCPVCDQGGECDLQDQSMRYGSDRGRFTELAGKRAVEPKNFGPLVKTEMTRCIQCTRCVRFANEVAGLDDLGTTGRGNDMQIGTYISQMLDSEMSGNIIDLCPVGALTSKPFAFTARPWELKSHESIDVMDAVGSNIVVDTRGMEVMRVGVRVNEDINEEWIHDKTRFSYDGLKAQRLTTPLVKQDGSLIPVSWQDALSHIQKHISNIPGEKMTAIAGPLVDTESLVCLKDMFAKLGSNNFRLDGKDEAFKVAPSQGVDFRSNYLFNTGIAQIEKADCMLIIGSNPKHEAPIINTRIRKTWLHSDLKIGLVGEDVPLTYDYDHIGGNVTDLKQLADGKHEFAKVLKAAKRPMILLGSGALEHEASDATMQAVVQIVHMIRDTIMTKEWNGFNILHRHASSAAALDIGFVPSTAATPKDSKFVYLLGADEFNPADIPRDAFVVYQGHHGDTGAQYADVVLPGATYTEKLGTYVNTEGRAQLTRAAVAPPGQARVDWQIIKALSDVIGVHLPYESIQMVWHRMRQISPSLTEYDMREDGLFNPFDALKNSIRSPIAERKWQNYGLPIQDFYLTDSISRASPVMAKCSKAFNIQREQATPQVAMAK